MSNFDCHSTRRAVLAAFAPLALGACQPSIPDGRKTQANPDHTIWAPPATPSLILAAALNPPERTRKGQTLSLWKDPDQLKAGLTSRRMNMVIMPTHTAAQFHNKGVTLRLISLLTRGLLYVVSDLAPTPSLTVLKGLSLAIPYRNDVPDLALARLAQETQLDLERDVSLHFTGTPIEAVQLMIAGKVRAALLPEPAATAAITRAKMFGKSLYRTLDFLSLWQGSFGPNETLPQAALVMRSDSAAPDLASWHRDLASALDRLTKDPKPICQQAAPAFGMPADILVNSVKASNLVTLKATDARPELERYFERLRDLNPALIGGSLPADRFYQ